jgi:hypothetical protein
MDNSQFGYKPKKKTLLGSQYNTGVQYSKIQYNIEYNRIQVNYEYKN